MEAVLHLERQPDADPGYNPGDVLYLDPADPLDGLVIKYKQDINEETTPTAAEQRRMIAGVKAGDMASARELTATHEGLVAAVVYPLKLTNAISPEDAQILLDTGSSALIRAALTYDRASGVDFGDHAVTSIRDTVTAPGSDFVARSYIDPEHPMESVYGFMEATRAVRGEKAIRKLREQRFRATFGMTNVEARILKRALYMKDEEIAGMPSIDKSKDGVGYIIRSFAKRNGLPGNNRTALILGLYERGMNFDVARPEKPLNELLYAHEVKIAKLLHLPSKDIVETLGLDCRVERVNEIVYEAREKVGARSTQELALMVRMFDKGGGALEVSHDDNRWRLARLLGLTSLEGYDIDELLSVTTDKQRRAISCYYLADRAVTWQEVGEELGVNYTSLQRTARNGILRILGHIGG